MAKARYKAKLEAAIARNERVASRFIPDQQHAWHLARLSSLIISFEPENDADYARVVDDIRLALIELPERFYFAFYDVEVPDGSPLYPDYAFHFYYGHRFLNDGAVVQRD